MDDSWSITRPLIRTWAKYAVINHLRSIPNCKKQSIRWNLHIPLRPSWKLYTSFFFFFFLNQWEGGTCFNSLKHLSAYAYLACQELCAGVDGLGVCNCHSDLGTTQCISLLGWTGSSHEKLLCAVTNAKTVINFQTKSQFIAFSSMYGLNSVCHLRKHLPARYIAHGK